MGIKLGSVVFAIVALFLVKITFETSLDTNTQAPQTTSASRAPASVDSIDEGYAIHMRGGGKQH